MSFGFGFGLPSWKTLSGGFSPASLFTQGEQGAWYDPSDLSTMFNDAAGTQPITSFTTNQPVGLLLDKSKGLVLGPELVTNGDFSVDTDWTLGSGWSISGGKLVATSVAFAVEAKQSIPSLVSRRYYTISFDAVVTSGELKVNLSNYGRSDTELRLTASGSYTYRTLFPVGVTAQITFWASATFTGSIDNVSVRELPGNHATQTSGSARPVLSKRYNLLTRTEEFENGAWGKIGTTVTPNTAVAPDGTTTADSWFINSGVAITTAAVGLFTSTSNAVLSGGPVTLAATSYTYAFCVKTGNGLTHVQLRAAKISNLNGASYGAIVRLSDGNLVGVDPGATATVISLSNGWFKIAVTFPATAASWYFGVWAWNDTSITANGTEHILLWGADLRRTIDANAFQPAYQRVVTATNYDGDGFLPYLEYSGAQAMRTGSIDFTATDKMTVWAGVTKLSDAADAILTELSATVSTNNGSFAVLAPYSSTANRLGFALRGDTARTNQITGSSPYAAPVTLVSSISYDIAETSSATEILPRVNGVVPSTSTAGAAESGAGNFGNYPLYIGARNLTSVFFTGRQYSLIVRGAQSSAAQISATESWMAQRTGVSL